MVARQVAFNVSVGRCLIREMVGHLHILEREGCWNYCLKRSLCFWLVGVISLDLFVVILVVMGLYVLFYRNKRLMFYELITP